MPKKVLISNLAKKDIQKIIRYIRLDKPVAAEQFKTLLLKKGRSLVTFSERGRKIPELEGTLFEGYREILVGPCRLVYTATDKEVRILRVLHSRQQFIFYSSSDFDACF